MSNAEAIRFFVHGIPKPKARSRTTRNKHTGKSVTYTPDQTVDWEQSILIQALAHKPNHPWDEPIGIGLQFHLPRPKSLSKKKKWPGVRPDLDNYAKSVLDALNGVYYIDDGRICEIVLRKQYSQDPGVEINLWKMIGMPEVKTG